MGEAKRRGTYEERKALAILLKQSQADQRIALDPAVRRHNTKLVNSYFAMLAVLAMSNDLRKPL